MDQFFSEDVEIYDNLDGLHEIFEDQNENFINSVIEIQNEHVNNCGLENFSANFVENEFASDLLQNLNSASQLVENVGNFEDFDNWLCEIFPTNEQDENLSKRTQNENGLNECDLGNISENFDENGFARNLLNSAGPFNQIAVYDHDFDQPPGGNIEQYVSDGGGHCSGETENLETNFLSSLKYIKFNAIKNVQKFKDRLLKYTSQAVILDAAIESSFENVCNEISDFVRVG